MPTIQNKQTIRNRLSEKRKSIPLFEQHQKSTQIVQRVKSFRLFKEAKEVAVYHAINGEANPRDLTSDTNKQFYLPVLSSNESQGLEFSLINQETQYQNNKFQIPEPIRATNKIQPNSLDLVIVPLLGFDLSGNRLGMGGGFYDRCFAFKKESLLKPFLIGFAYDFQEVEKIQAESWDIGLDAIATETRFIEFKKPF